MRRDFDIYGMPGTREGESRCLTGADWAAGRGPTGTCYGYRWVDPSRQNRTKEEWPYSYSDHYLWGENKEGCHAVYSDRLSQWDGDKFKAACAAVPRKRFTDFTKADCSKFLSAYYGKPIKAVALSEGCNVSSGYPYWVFYYEDGK